MKFFLTQPLFEAGIKAMEDEGIEYFIAGSPNIREYMEEAKEADAILIRNGLCMQDIIEECPKLKVIGRTGVGYDNVDVKYAASKGIPTVITPGANSLSVAEHTIAGIFMLSKNIREADAELRNGNWNIRDAGKNFEIAGKKIGIVGVGAIGAHIARLCQALGMTTAGFSHSKNRAKVEAAGCEYYEELDDMLRDCDFISLNCPLTSETKHMISRRELSLMKKTACIINCGRGALINEADLRDCLNEGVIAGAFIDVYSVEPAVLSNPVFEAKNCILTPHSAALTKEANDKMQVNMVKGCIAICKGEKWKDVVIREVYDHEKWK